MSLFTILLMRLTSYKTILSLAHKYHATIVTCKDLQHFILINEITITKNALKGCNFLLLDIGEIDNKDRQ